MKEFPLQFRALLPDGTWFYQRDQYLTSFLRRVKVFWDVSHEKYLQDTLEAHLQILVDNEWVQCAFNKD